MSLIKFNGMEIEGNVEIITTENGFIVKSIDENKSESVKLKDCAVEECTAEEQSAYESWLDSLEGDNEVSNEEHLTLKDMMEEKEEPRQFNIMITEGYFKFFHDLWLEEKADSPIKLHKREFVGKLIMDKFREEYEKYDEMKDTDEFLTALGLK